MQLLLFSLCCGQIAFTSLFCLHRYVTIAGAVAHFYWAKGERDRMPRFPVGLALKNTIKYAWSFLLDVCAPFEILQK